MSGISFKKENNIIISKNILTDNSKIYIPQSKKAEISENEEDNLELSNKNKLLAELPETSSGSESPINFSDNIFIESINNNHFDNKITNRDSSPELDYFLCNEQFIKENNPEGNNYKDKSKNYKLKINFINNIKIEDIEINKINKILKDIEQVQNNNNNNNNNNYNININIGKDEGNEINKLSYIKDESFNVDNLLLCSYINNYKFNCKKFNLNLFYHL